MDGGERWISPPRREAWSHYQVDVEVPEQSAERTLSRPQSVDGGVAADQHCDPTDAGSSWLPLPNAALGAAGETHRGRLVRHKPVSDHDP
jgi:hypothetical protein